MVNSLSNFSYEERLKKLGLPSLEYQRIRADVIEVYKILNQLDRVSINKFFTIMDHGWYLDSRQQFEGLQKALQTKG